MAQNKELKIVDDLEITDYYRDKKGLIKDVKGLIRKIKIGNILEDNLLYFDKNNVPKHINKSIKKYGKYGVVTGSSLLCMYGLLKDVGDLDLIIDSKNYELLKSKILPTYDYPSEDNPDYKGKIKDGNLEIDVFVNDDINFLEKDDIKVDSLSRALEKKLELFENENRGKDYHHFHNILKCVKEGYYIAHNKDIGKKFFSYENFKNIFVSKT
jgi:hypothetical protein